MLSSLADMGSEPWAWGFPLAVLGLFGHLPGPSAKMRGGDMGLIAP